MSNEIKWSKAQQAAIDSNHTNELLNAGAGSGKTAVLTAHVVKILESGYDLDNLLIMTFTNAAAKLSSSSIPAEGNSSISSLLITFAIYLGSCDLSSTPVKNPTRLKAITLNLLRFLSQSGVCAIFSFENNSRESQPFE